MKLENKTLEAVLRGYVFFKVNDDYFLTYAKAKERRVSLTDSGCENIVFIGLHLFKGWIAFYKKVNLQTHHKYIID